MSMNDPIANLLTCIRNAVQAGYKNLSLPTSKTLTRIVNVLKEEGFIGDYEVYDQKPAKMVKIFLRNRKDGTSFIHSIKRISRCSRRIYVKASQIPEVLSGIGIVIMSTPRGIMSGERARSCGVGGEILCEVY